MARLLGLILPDTARIEYALTMFYGIGWDGSGKILKNTGINKQKRVRDLSEEDLKMIGAEIEKLYVVEGNLREQVNDHIKRLREIGSYRGGRHTKGLPLYGQRTKSNARTKRGKRKTVGALKKEVWAKLETAAPAAAGKK